MLEFLHLPLLTAATVIPAATALVVRRSSDPELTRKLSAFGVVASMVCLISAVWMRATSGHDTLFESLWNGLEVDVFNGPILILYAALTLVTILVAPRRDASGGFMAGILFMFAASILAYAGSHLWVVVLGWWLTGLPFVFGVFSGARHRRHHQPVIIALILSGIAISVAAMMVGPNEMDFSHGSTAAMVLLIIAVVLRKGIFPAHSWLVRAFEFGSPLATALFFNGHLGALIIVRAESTHLAAPAQQALHYLSWAALFTALYTSLLMIAERKPRRILALLCVSQAAFVLAGLCSANEAGIAGSLVHWMVVAAASTGLVCVYRALEVRFAHVEDLDRYLGLSAHTPRLGVFFLVCGLALVGLPGTLGYCAEDLLFHGALESEPFLGIALLLATALNAIHLFRLYSRLFLGQPPTEVPVVPDALPRERWPLTFCVAFLIIGGILPSMIVAVRSPAAEIIATALGLGHGGH